MADAAAHIADAEIDKQLALLAAAQDAHSQGRTLAILSVLFSQCSDENTVAVAAAVPRLVELAQQSDSSLVKANAVAALAAAAALDDGVAAAVAAAASQPLAQLLQQCSGPEGAADLQLNVVAALGQLARDQEAAAQAAMDAQVLPCLLALADSSKPAKLQEAVADTLCALASHTWAHQQLYDTGAVLSVCELLHAQHPEVAVRCLMVLGMLLTRSSAARQQLAGSGPAMQQLLVLLVQREDADARVIARDLLGLLMRDEATKAAVEAAMRQPQQQQAEAEPQAEEQVQARV